MGGVESTLSVILKWMPLFIRGFFNPRLVAEFDESLHGCIVNSVGTLETVIPTTTACRYARIKVINSRRFWQRLGIRAADDCQGVLENVELKGDDGEFVQTNYSNSLPLKWADEGGKTSTSIAASMSKFLDVLHTQANCEIFFLETPNLPIRYGLLFDPAWSMKFHGLTTFVIRLTIKIFSKENSPTTIKLVVEWRNNWSDFTIQKPKANQL